MSWFHPIASIVLDQVAERPSASRFIAPSMSGTGVAAAARLDLRTGDQQARKPRSAAQSLLTDMRASKIPSIVSSSLDGFSEFPEWTGAKR